MESDSLVSKSNEEFGRTYQNGAVAYYNNTTQISPVYCASFAKDFAYYSYHQDANVNGMEYYHQNFSPNAEHSGSESLLSPVLPYPHPSECRFYEGLIAQWNAESTKSHECPRSMDFRFCNSSIQTSFVPTGVQEFNQEITEDHHPSSHSDFVIHSSDDSTGK